MPVLKYKKYYTLMLDQNKALFEKFRTIHDAFEKDQEQHAKVFHSFGLDVLDTIRFWERKLCAGMERGKNSAYSNKLADKFWGEVRAEYPLVDMIGVKNK